MESTKDKTGWTKKNYNKCLKVLAKYGEAGFDHCGIRLVVPELNLAFTPWGAEVEYRDGIGILFRYDITLSLEDKWCHVIYERTFYYSKVEDRTFMTLDGYACEIFSQAGFVDFSNRPTMLHSVYEWAKERLKDYKQQEKK